MVSASLKIARVSKHEVAQMNSPKWFTAFAGLANRASEDLGFHHDRQKAPVWKSGLVLALAFTASLPAAVPPVVAQDVPGIEACTRETRLDRRTGCLQSNIEYLQQLIAKNALDTQQKLAAANRQIAAQKDAAAAAAKEIAALKDALAAVQARLARPELTPAAAAAKEITALRDALTELKARMDQAQRAKPDGK
jgi:septal ring factor EnvC (AmiA/AmiB activator)